MRQGTFSAYNLRPPESERHRQANVHCSNIEIAKKWKQKKIHKQMNGIRRSDIHIQWNNTQPQRNGILPFVTTRMDLEGIMLSEINQTETNTV